MDAISAFNDGIECINGPYKNGVIYVSGATGKYNCHSYAWHDQNPATNLFWMGTPSLYITDLSYIIQNWRFGTLQ